MITELLLNILFFIPNKLLEIMPAITFALPDGIFNGMSSILYGICYVLPVAGLLPIFFLSLSFYAFKIVWAIVIRVKSFIPTMGG